MRSAVIAIIAAMLFACQGDTAVTREVGARCDLSSECDERCLTPSATYPDGFCSISCNSRDECPDTTTCADRDGGVCLFECDENTDCNFLGVGWRCEAAPLRGGTTTVMVCRGN